MARRTIAAKRGSVRGAPPGVYAPFGTFLMEGAEDVIRSIVRFFGFLFKGAFLIVIVVFCCVIYYAFSESRYSD